jgi:hypothetical protein
MNTMNRRISTFTRDLDYSQAWVPATGVEGVNYGSSDLFALRNNQIFLQVF